MFADFRVFDSVMSYYFLFSAVELFQLGAAWGHVDCAYELGVMSATGEGGERSALDAAKNLLVVAQARC